MTEAITERPEPDVRHHDVAREWAPSVMTTEEPVAARWIGGLGLTFFLVGLAVLVLNGMGWTQTRVGMNGGALLLIIGLVGMLYHAASDADLQIRRAYLVLGFLWLAGATFATLYWVPQVGTYFLRFGYPSFVLALLFLLAAVRHETDASWRGAILGFFALLGVAGALTGLIGGTINEAFLLSYGLPVALLGLGFLWAFIGLVSVEDDRGHRMAIAAGVAGTVMFGIAFVRWLLPTIFASIPSAWGWTQPGPFLASVGIIQMAIGLLYMAVAVGLGSENRFVVLTRRELAAFFFSPLAYFILLGFALLSAFQFGMFVWQLTILDGGIGEPIIASLVLDLIPVFWMVLAVPLLTMRLFSEEHRSGTMEVLLTAPVTDAPIVLSKFLAVLVVFLSGWVVSALFLVALRIEGGQSFDYRPIISFGVALLCSGASFLAMGLFFSMVTRNQIVAGVLTAAAMLALVIIGLLQRFGGTSAWVALADYVSFLQLWRNTLQGKLALRDVAFQVSATIVWLFLTVKVLESRKWR